MSLIRLSLVPAVLALALAGCAVSPPTGGVSANGTVRCDYRPGGSPATPVDLPPVTDVPATGTATLTLDLGDTQVRVELDRAAAPCTVNSFESLAQQGYFNGTECHRLSTQGIFILQCGDPTGTGRGGPGYAFNDELAQTKDYPAGTVAMANSGRDTNGSQFFLVYADTPLPPQYTAFGRMDTAGIEAIAQRAEQGHDASYPDGTGRPNVPTVITSVVSG
ncbi:MAG: peptidylprolyl isomerase [Propioniciclava sp.]|uniref:peptidylprolyl isomerase n=1 Tax=Propioniciclava sp. TaxID=2038686 RepID=UPI0039E5559B